MLDTIASPLRWLHVVSATAWFGEVLVINAVILPAFQRCDAKGQETILREILPRMFKLATLLSLAAVVSGTLLVHSRVGGDWSRLLDGRWGYAIMVGGGLGWLVTIFHLVVEKRFARVAGFDTRTSETALARMHVVLSVVPRVALLTLFVAFMLMMIAVRG